MITETKYFVDSFDLIAILKDEQGISPVRITFVNRVFDHIELYGKSKSDFADLRGNIYSDLHDLGEMSGRDPLDLRNL